MNTDDLIDYILKASDIELDAIRRVTGDSFTDENY